MFQIHSSLSPQVVRLVPKVVRLKSSVLRWLMKLCGFRHSVRGTMSQKDGIYWDYVLKGVEDSLVGRAFWSILLSLGNTQWKDYGSHSV